MKRLQINEDNKGNREVSEKNDHFQNFYDEI